MRSAHLLISVPSGDVRAAFTAVSDFTRFPSLAQDVRAVRTDQAVRGSRVSFWEVNFRRGVLRWHEWESVDADRLRIEFGQTDGDFADFIGFWQLSPAGNGFRVRFEVSWDFGIESLAGIMDPIAERVVKRVICSVLAGLFGDLTVVEGGEALADLAGIL
jgi:ribosome-associated toxin RatA of RatAB toxin-antitoxin module